MIEEALENLEEEMYVKIGEETMKNVQYADEHD